MDAIMVSFTFTNPNYLWILSIVPFLLITHLFTLKRAKVAALKFANFEAIEKVAKKGFFAVPYQGVLVNKNIFLLLLRLVVYSLIILAASGTTIHYTAKGTNIDFVLAMDASSSMLANDVSPNRLEAAKNAGLLFIDNAKNLNIGLVSFAGAVFIEERITSEHEKLKNTLSALAIKETGGTNIGDAIITATNQFAGNRSKVIILLTDGQSNIGTQIPDAISYAKNGNVIIDAIGIGTEQGGNFTEGAISKLDEESLKAITNSTGGRYFKTESNEQLEKAYLDILNLTETVLAKNISWILILIALVLLSLELLLVNTIYRTIP